MLNQAKDGSIGMGVHLDLRIKQKTKWFKNCGPFSSKYQAKDISIEMWVHLLPNTKQKTVV